MKAKITEIRAQIESAIQNHQIRQVEALVAKYLKLESRSPESRFAASEYLRRISKYRRALEVLACHREPPKVDRLTDDELKVFIQHARLRNLLGGSMAAFELFKRLSIPQKTKFANLIAPVLISNYQFNEALPLVAPLEAHIKKGETYSNRLRAINLIDTLSGLEKFDEALLLLQKLLAASDEPLLQAILQEVKGGIYVDLGDWKNAEQAYLTALTAFPRNTDTVDIGYLCKGLGALAIHQKKFEEAKLQLDRAMKILFRPGFKPEIWLGVLYWQGRLAWAMDPARFPHEWMQVLAFPIPRNRFIKEIKKHTEIPAVLSFDLKKSNYTIDLSADVSYSKNQVTLGLNVPQNILAHLVAAHPYGIPQYRICDFQWQDYYCSEAHLKKRLEQAILRMRRELHAPVEWQDGHMSIQTLQNLPRVTRKTETEKGIRGEIFFQRFLATEFERKDIEAFFDCGRTPADALIKQWLSQSIIQKSARGRFQILAKELQKK